MTDQAPQAVYESTADLEAGGHGAAPGVQGPEAVVGAMLAQVTQMIEDGAKRVLYGESPGELRLPFVTSEGLIGEMVLRPAECTAHIDWPEPLHSITIDVATARDIGAESQIWSDVGLHSGETEAALRKPRRLDLIAIAVAKHRIDFSAAAALPDEDLAIMAGLSPSPLPIPAHERPKKLINELDLEDYRRAIRNREPAYSPYRHAPK